MGDVFPHLIVSWGQIGPHQVISNCLGLHEDNREENTFLFVYQGCRYSLYLSQNQKST